MIFHRPPNKLYRLLSPDKSAIETMVLHLSPYSVGRIGGEMARRMVDAAETYLTEITASEIKRSFRGEIKQSLVSKNTKSTSAFSKSGAVPSAISPSVGEVPASQYPSDSEPH